MSKVTSRRLEYIEAQKQELLDSKEISKDIIESLFEKSAADSMESLKYHKKIVLGMVVLGSLMIFVGIIVCIERSEIFDKINEHQGEGKYRPTPAMVTVNFENGTSVVIPEYDENELNPEDLAHSHCTNEVNPCFFGISQILISLGLMCLVIGVVAYKVLDERISEMKRHALTRTWLEVVMPNRSELKNVSDSYEQSKKKLDAIPFNKLGLAELSKDTYHINVESIR